MTCHRQRRKQKGKSGQAGARRGFFLLPAFCLLLCSCQQFDRGPAAPGGSTAALTTGGSETSAKPTAKQAADVKIAFAYSAELRGETDQALAAYQEAVQKDPSRGDGHWRLARLYDKQAKFKESAEHYRQALAAQPNDARIHADHGYSCYLQSRWAEAEASLRRAIALRADLRHAHNNLGLVLAHAGRCDEALAEFHKAGCDQADAYCNLAYVRALERDWDEARRLYREALAVNARCAHARKGLMELDAVTARLDSSPSRDDNPIRPVDYREPAAPAP